MSEKDLAARVKRDFPLYQVEASILKEINSQKGIDRALELYDTVVLPMNPNQNITFLFRMGFPLNWCSKRLHPRK